MTTRGGPPCESSWGSPSRATSSLCFHKAFLGRADGGTVGCVRRRALHWNVAPSIMYLLTPPGGPNVSEKGAIQCAHSFPRHASVVVNYPQKRHVTQIMHVRVVGFVRGVSGVVSLPPSVPPVAITPVGSMASIMQSVKILLIIRFFMGVLLLQSILFPIYISLFYQKCQK